MSAFPGYRRCLLKLSGEALGGDKRFGIDKTATAMIADQLAQAHASGHQIGIVVGAGNIMRGADSNSIGVPHLVGDHMGMICTVLNGIALKWALAKIGIPCTVMSAFPVSYFVDLFNPEKAKALLEAGSVVMFVGGTGNPCFTTDSAAALRAIEIDADVLIKATQADGVFDRDPNKFEDAVLFDTITPQQILEQRLGVMDASAIEILGRKGMPTIVLNIHKHNNITRALNGERVGTLVV